jgi:hypothetical protein
MLGDAGWMTGATPKRLDLDHLTLDLTSASLWAGGALAPSRALFGRHPVISEAYFRLALSRFSFLMSSRSMPGRLPFTPSQNTFASPTTISIALAGS